MRRKSRATDRRQVMDSQESGGTDVDLESQVRLDEVDGQIVRPTQAARGSDASSVKGKTEVAEVLCTETVEMEIGKGINQSTRRCREQLRWSRGEETSDSETLAGDDSDGHLSGGRGGEGRRVESEAVRASLVEKEQKLFKELAEVNSELGVQCGRPETRRAKEMN
jgi:hypothetical protein